MLHHKLLAVVASLATAVVVRDAAELQTMMRLLLVLVSSASKAPLELLGAAVVAAHDGAQRAVGLPQHRRQAALARAAQLGGAPEVNLRVSSDGSEISDDDDAYSIEDTKMALNCWQGLDQSEALQNPLGL